MPRTFKEAVKNRRSIYALTGESTVSDKEIQEMLEFALLNVPSGFNSQSTRLVLLLGKEHKKLWGGIVMETLRKIVPAENFGKTEEKINSFAAAHGTVLYFEDMKVIKELQEKFPAYADNFPVWAEHTNAMHQFSLWCMLEDAGMGASLQHYNPIIDEEVKKTWGLETDWELRAQMPFGVQSAGPGEKTFLPLEQRLKVFK